MANCAPTCRAPGWDLSSNKPTQNDLPREGELMPVSRIPLVIPEKLKESVRSTSSNVDVTGLEMELRRTIEGEVRFDAGSKALYATDGSNYRQVPIGVVIPEGVDDVIAAVEACRRHG